MPSTNLGIGCNQTGIGLSSDVNFDFEFQAPRPLFTSRKGKKTLVVPVGSVSYTPIFSCKVRIFQ